MPAHTTVPPRSTARSAAGTSAPAGAKMIAASRGSGGSASDGPAHAAPSSRAKRLAGRVAGAREGEDLAALGAGDLRDDVGRGAEAVEPEPLGPVAGGDQGAVADEAGAEERRGVGGAQAGREGEAVALVGHGVLGVAAVEVVAGEACVGAEVLAARPAEAAGAAGPPQPGNADPRAGVEARDVGAEGDDFAHDLMAEHERELGVGQLAVDDVQVGAAHAARRDPQQHLVRSGNGHRQARFAQRPPRGVEEHRAHGAE